jgi:hypothetical protein
LGARIFGLSGAIVLSITAILTAPFPAPATPMTYTFFPATGATATYSVPPLGTMTITGTFVFDPSGLSGPSLNSANIDVTGTIFSGIYNVADSATANAFTATATNGIVLRFTFVNTLSSSPDPLASVSTTPDDTPDIGPTDSATGGAVPVAAPEPTSLALMGGALGLFLLGRTGRQRPR